MTKKVISISIVCVLTFVVLFFVLSGNVSYKKAYENTKMLKNYTMEIVTSVIMTDGLDMKQTILNQLVEVENKGSKNMIYSVETKAESTDYATDETVREENSYIFANGAYYYSYPGVKYKSPTDFDMALSNITNLTDIISFDEDEIEIYETKKDGKKTSYTFQVGYESVSEFIKGTLESAISVFEGADFYPEYMSATGVVEGKYIKEGSFMVRYITDEGMSVVVKVNTNLTDTSAKVEKPDESEYANIYGN